MVGSKRVLVQLSYLEGAGPYIRSAESMPSTVYKCAVST
jgi:hypothetical protein